MSRRTDRPSSLRIGATRKRLDARRSRSGIRRRTRWNWVRWYPIKTASSGLASILPGCCSWHLWSSSETSFRFCAINALRMPLAMESVLAIGAKALISSSMAVNSRLFSSSYCFLAGSACHSSGLRCRVIPRKRSFTILRSLPSKYPPWRSVPALLGM